MTLRKTEDTVSSRRKH